MDIKEYSYLWDKSQWGNWALHKGEDYHNYSIVGLANLNEVGTLTIEDDEIYYAVVRKMLSRDVRILTEDEMGELTQRGVPEEILNGDKDELWNSIKDLLNQEHE